MNRQTFDPEKFNLDIAFIKKSGNQYEVVVDAEEAISFREKGGDILDVLKSEKIFADAQRGQEAAANTFQDSFGTEETLQIAEIILKEGEIKLTAEHRKAQIEKKRNQIVTAIQTNAIDPRINAPHTRTRVEDALDAAKVHIDEFKDVDEQVKEIIKKLQPILPLRFETKKIFVNVGSQYSHQLYGYLKKFKILNQQWGSDNSWAGTVEIPGGLENDFYDNINKMTHGTVETKIEEEK